MIAKPEGHKVVYTKTRLNTEPPQTMGVTANNKATATEPPAYNGQQPIWEK